MTNNHRTTPLDSFVDHSAPICYGILKPGEHNPNGIPVIKVKNIVGGKIIEKDLRKTSPHIHAQYKRAEVKHGDLLLTIRGSTGRVAIVPESLSGANITQDTARIRVSSNDDPLYVFYALHSPSVQQQIDLNTVGQAVKGINIGEVKKLKIFHPPRSEQKKIARILSTWDKAITTTEKLLTNSQQQKKALMQQLLTAKKRLQDKNGVRFSGEWETYKFGNLFKERVETGRDDLPLLSITADDGVVYQEDTGRKNTSNEDKSKYRRICVNDIGYNTMRMWQGRSSLSDKEGIVSPAYTIVTPTGKVCPAYAAYLFKIPALVHVFYRHSQGLVSDTWNLKFNHFKKISWQVPSIDEQEKIAAALSAADHEITALQKNLDAFKQEKEALMQQMLAGKRRVKIQ